MKIVIMNGTQIQFDANVRIAKSEQASGQWEELWLTLGRMLERQVQSAPIGLSVSIDIKKDEYDDHLFLCEECSEGK